MISAALILRGQDMPCPSVQRFISASDFAGRGAVRFGVRERCYVLAAAARRRYTGVAIGCPANLAITSGTEHASVAIHAMKKLDVPQSGSQASTTASRNRFGQYNRTRAMPTQPRTAAQIAVRSSFADISARWKTLTDEQRAAWGTYAGTVPLTDSLGQTYYLTGHQTFTSVNRSLTAASLAGVSVPPAIGAVAPSASVAVSDATISALALTLGESALAGNAIIYSSPPRSPGVTFNGDYRQVANTELDVTGDTEIELFDTLAARFGALRVGQKYFLKVIEVSTTGVASQEQRLVVTITS